MQKLIHNITNLYGAKGKRWLDELDSIKNSLIKQWSLTNVRAVANMTYHFVAKATKDQNLPVVLKIGCDSQAICNEAKALEHFNGQGSIKLIDKNVQGAALLLEQATAAHSLLDNKDRITIYTHLVKKLLKEPQGHDFNHVRLWLESLDKCTSDSIPTSLVDKAVRLKNKLLDETNQELVLHGDLHLDNIVEHKGQWLAIDPKGVIGPIEFEIAKYDNIKELAMIAKKLHLDVTVVHQWAFVRNVLAAVWMVEDHSDPSQFISHAFTCLHTYML